MIWRGPGPDLFVLEPTFRGTRRAGRDEAANSFLGQDRLVGQRTNSTLLLSFRRLQRNDGVTAQLDAAEKGNDRAFADAIAREQLVQRVDRGGGRVVQSQDDVALDQ